MQNGSSRIPTMGSDGLILASIIAFQQDIRQEANEGYESNRRGAVEWKLIS